MRRNVQGIPESSFGVRSGNQLVTQDFQKLLGVLLAVLIAVLIGLALAACGVSRGVSAFPLERKELSASEEAAGILAHSIRIRTPNPPGNERPLAETYVSLLASEGIDARGIPVPSDSGAALVPTETPAQRALAWARYPGRGTQPPLVRRGLTLDRDLILLATPDEEAGGIHGAGYVTRAHRDLLGNARYLLTEGNDAQAKRAARRSRVKSTRKRSAQRGEAQPS